MATQENTTLPFHTEQFHPERSDSSPVESADIQPSMTVREAGPIWLESRRPFLSERTYIDYRWQLKRLNKFLSHLRLDRVTPDTIRGYQRQRLETAGSSCINKECAVLLQILRRARLWTHSGIEDYQPLPLPAESPGRALTEEEEERLFAVASLIPSCEVVYNVALLSVHTGAGPGEIKHLRLKDVYLGDGDYTPDAWIKIREGAKNWNRLRKIPLNRESFGAVQALLRIAQSRGAHLPDHYLLPARVNHGTYYDPTRHQTTFKTAWNGMLAAADITHFRMYDLRHHALTRMAETNPEHVVLKIAGHVSGNMLRKVYAHVRDDAVRKAIDGLSRRDGGWKPSPATARKIMPRTVSRAKMIAATRNANQIVKEETDDSWITLAGEAS